MAARRDAVWSARQWMSRFVNKPVITLPDIGVAIATWLTDLCLLIARPASMRILAAFLGTACKITFFEFWPGAAISAAA